MASVRIENEAFGDDRYEVLARLAGLADADHARGKMARLWRQCTIEKRYTLSETDVQLVLGDRGVDALVSARLGERTADGVRIRGTKGRVEWLENLRKNGKKGGRPRKNQKESNAKTKRKPSGFEELNPLAPVLVPALALAPVPPPTGESQTRAPDLDRAMATVMAPGQREAALTTRIWFEHCDRHEALRVELKVEIPSLNRSDQAMGWRDLRERVKAYGDTSKAEEACRHVLAVREAEARRGRSLQWFGDLVWRQDQFTRALSMSVDGIRAGPPTRASPRPQRLGPVAAILRDIAKSENPDEVT